MKISILGDEIKEVRNAFGMAVEPFAAVLAVHPGTVRRWEAAGNQHVPVDGVAANVLAVARQRLRGSPKPTQKELQQIGEAIAAALVAAGTLIALGILIEWLTERR